MSEMDPRGDDLTYEEGELPIEAPEGDAAEQQRRTSDDDQRRPRTSVPLEADPADAAEQDRVVDLDDDDYR
ncbi:hypothetical protein [Nonomuraea indica]|uniref:Uncharacterized protein n=1 Tax=Nonomuraea indica TaxID=1581193 RepID=A0ABW8ABX4_9ACTN|nr:hypothetical protein [Nonomuraea indica]